jgi:HTH-type transcriptional repressor of NAD biosynthesis genes
MRRGLVVGKFVPLHRGHQLLIDAALSECDDVSVVVYDTNVPDNPLPVSMAKRLGWLRDLYPQLENIVGLPDPLEPPESNDPENAAVYADQLLPILGSVDRFFSSEPSYDEFARRMGATHVVLDEARELVPISGTAIRSDPYRHRGMMDPLVYASLIQKVALVGTESAGKSTLAKALADEYDTRWVHEFGRELWEAQELKGTFTDHLKIARRQYEREQAAARHANRFLFCDTTAWTTMHWSLRSYGCVDARLVDLVDRTMGEYVWVLCDNDFGWIQDGTREMAGGEAARFQEQQRIDLTQRLDRFRLGPWHLVGGSVEDRVATVKTILS